MIEVTAAAAAELRDMLAARQAPAGTGLRLMVEKGGCAGWQYSMTLGIPAPGDAVVEQEGALFIVDAASTAFLQGSRIEFEDSLNDSGFKIHNPNASRSCGCGTSFEPAVPSDPISSNRSSPPAGPPDNTVQGHAA